MNPVLKDYAQKAALAGVLAISVPLAASFEGLRERPYYDVTGILTICYGETLGVNAKDRKTPAECRTMLETRMQGFAIQVDNLVTVPMTTERWAAMTDFAYNVGINKFAKTTLLKKLNSGDTVGACNELLRWRFAGPVELEGLKRRRIAERELCMKGVQ
jgi:lysozyme